MSFASTGSRLESAACRAEVVNSSGPSECTDIRALYRTGDLAKRHPTNILEFRGRAVHQVKVLVLWSEVLGSPVTGATADFFDLGGNSSHAAIIHVRLIEMTGRRIAITELFALPHARSIAEFLAPKSPIHAGPTAHDRARLAQAGRSRFRRPRNR